MYGLRIFPDENYDAQAESIDPAGNEFAVEHAPGNPVLPTIENKCHNQTFPPPSRYIRIQIDDHSSNVLSKMVLD